MIDTKPQIQEAQEIPSRINTKKIDAKAFYIQTVGNQGQRENLERSWVWRETPYL